MISSNDLKPGMTIQQDGEIFVVLEQSQNKTARSAMVVKAKVRNLRTGSNVELSWGGGDKITPAHIEKKEMQYLYDTDDALVFMDNETYEQIEIPKDRLKWEMNFMKGDTATSASKNATLESGLEIKVPLFINQDEMVLVNTSDGKYSGRAKD